jgi:ABC-type multidrug transport system fused ATPase/permease subunit
VIDALAANPPREADAVKWGASILLVSVVTAISANHLFFQVLKLMTRWRAGITLLIFEKALRLQDEARLLYSTGEVVSLVTTHLQRIVTALNFIFSLWIHPLQIAITLALLYSLVGIAGLFGAFTLMLIMALSLSVSILSSKFRAAASKAADSRLGLLTETLNAIRTVKMYGWELALGAEVLRRRALEERAIRGLAWVRAGGNTVAVLCPTIATLVTLGSARALGEPLSTGTVFAVLGLIFSLRLPVTTFPDIFNQWIEALVHVGAIRRFLEQPDAARPVTDITHPFAVDLKAGELKFGERTILAGVNLTIAPGRSVAICGPVGAGKTSLLRIVVGDLSLTNGGVVRSSDAVGYVSQVPWIANDTVRNNILFGSQLNELRLQEAIDAAQLQTDLVILPNGLETQIGERGVNLSGGQRQRIAIARALYSEAPLLVLDDPFSALDPRVGVAVAKAVFHGKLRDGRTLIVATHQDSLAEYADQVLDLTSGILAPRTSLDSKPSEESRIAQEVSETNSARNETERSSAEAPERTIQEEERAVGAVARSIWKRYFSDYLRWPCTLILLPFALKEILSLSNDVTVTRAATGILSAEHHQTIAILTISLAGVLLVRTAAVFSRGTRIASVRHQELLQGVLRSPVVFFDRNPVGRVLNRFANDMQQLDETVPSMILESLAGLCTIVGILALAGIVEPWIIIPFALIFSLLAWARRLYRPASRDTMRLDSVGKSPILSQLSETYSGAAVIRAFGRADYVRDAFLERLENSSRANQSMVACNRWVGMWVEGSSVLINLSILAAAIWFPHRPDPVLVGLVVTYGLTMTGTINWLFRTAAMLENGLTAAERVDFYANLSPERYSGDKSAKPGDSIAVDKLSVRYRPDLPLVLKDFSLSLKPGEHVGIVGRTGAGKSTILQALLRLIEPASGTIKYSGVDAQTFDLTRLRRGVSLIPQEPVTFSGTIRFNLDPLNEHTDVEIESQLRRVGLHLKLETQLAEGGANISFGERQLLCLVRALLRRSQILLLDEATSGTDAATDARIQELLRTEFKHCTIIAIAHRRETLSGYDRVITL